MKLNAPIYDIQHVYKIVDQDYKHSSKETWDLDNDYGDMDIINPINGFVTFRDITFGLLITSSSFYKQNIKILACLEYPSNMFLSCKYPIKEIPLPDWYDSEFDRIFRINYLSIHMIRVFREYSAMIGLCKTSSDIRKVVDSLKEYKRTPSYDGLTKIRTLWCKVSVPDVCSCKMRIKTFEHIIRNYMDCINETKCYKSRIAETFVLLMQCYTNNRGELSNRFIDCHTVAEKATDMTNEMIK